MVHCLQRTQTQWTHHATGCLNSLELDIQHAQVCPWLSHGALSHHWGKGHETMEIQAQGYGVAYCRSTTGYIRGIFSFKIVSSLLFNDHFIALKTCHPLFFLCNSQHCNCYPIMDHLDQHLATSALNLALPASIHAATTLGKHTLNKPITLRCIGLQWVSLIIFISILL